MLEEQRALHEELERLQQAIADRYQEEPKTVRQRLRRDHEVAYFLNRVTESAKRLVGICKDKDNYNAEIQQVATGDPYASFYDQYKEIKDFHRRYPNKPVENLERDFAPKLPGEPNPILSEFESMFTGEEGYGRYFDLTMLHDLYLNLPSTQGARRPSYLQYLDIFDEFSGIKRSQKMTDSYFQYLGYLAGYLESFMRRTRPLENFDKIFAGFEKDFEEKWTAGTLPGWQRGASEEDEIQGRGDRIWCTACEKEFTNVNVYEHHLTQKKHLKAVAARQANGDATTNGEANGLGIDTKRLKEKAIAEREFRVKRLAAAMQTERGDTRHNVERRQGMTEREREQELAMLYAEDEVLEIEKKDEGNNSDDEGKIYNPLKLPIAWDGKPIPYWLYKLHGLGVEFPCEICGNYVYMGRRAFDKHFIEPRHIWGLKALGITSTNLFREITSQQEAKDLWDKFQTDKKKERQDADNVVQMEDAQGNVMPEKVYNDLRKQGLLCEQFPDPPPWMPLLTVYRIRPRSDSHLTDLG